VRPLERRLKRVLDVTVAAAGLTLGAPVLAIAALAIRLEDGGPVFFRQERIGQHGEAFDILKLRTMVVGAESLGAGYAVDEGDSRITRVGALLRKTSLDELPELVNVLRGDMSLVGPRPCLPNQAEVIAARRARNVFDIRPGITGVAQLAAIDMSTPEKLAEADKSYMQRRSFFGDLAIIARTVLGGGGGDALKG